KITRQLHSLESRLPRVDERRKIVHDGGRDDVLEVHPEDTGFEIGAAVHGSHLHTSLVALRRLRIEHSLIFREAEIEGGGLEGIPIICEQTHVIDVALENAKHCADTAAQTSVRYFF